MRRLLSAAFLIGALASCSLLGPEYGTLVLGVSSSDMAARTIVPNLDMEIATYNVLGAGPYGAQFEETGVSASTTAFSRDALVAGEWTVTVDAYNEAAGYIGTGNVTARIEPRRISNATVLVTPLDGEGSLETRITWPSGTLDDPRVEGILAPVGKGNSQLITFVMDEHSATHAFDGLSVGYYTLSVQLYDGDDLRAGLLEAVRILSGQITVADVELDPGTGQLGLNIVAEMGNPIGISLAGGLPEVAYGQDMTITATPDRPIDSYAWYLNGEPLSGKTSGALTIGNGLPVGVYRLDVLVLRGMVASSASYMFAVGPGLITYRSQSRYVRVENDDEVKEASAAGFEDFDATVGVSRQGYSASATQTSTLSPHRIEAVGYAEEGGPFDVVEPNTQEAISHTTVAFTLNQPSLVTLSGELRGGFDTEGTNLGSRASVGIRYGNAAPLYEAVFTEDLYPTWWELSVDEAFHLEPGDYTLELRAWAAAEYEVSYPGWDSFGGGGYARYSIELTVAPAP